MNPIKRSHEWRRALPHHLRHLDPGAYLFQPVLDDPAGYIAGAGADNRIFLGAFLELLLIIANIGTALVLFPILKRQNEVLALGFVTARVMECVFIAVGILSVLTVVTLAAGSAGADAGARSRVGRSPRSRIGRSCSDPASLSASGTG